MHCWIKYKKWKRHTEGDVPSICNTLYHEDNGAIYGLITKNKQRKQDAGGRTKQARFAVEGSKQQGPQGLVLGLVLFKLLINSMSQLSHTCTNEGLLPLT